MSHSPDAYLLICQCGEHRCALPLGQVIETMRPLPVEPLAGMPSFLLGLAAVRGEAVPVVDLACLVGSTGGRPGRYITLRLGARIVAAAVTAVIGIRAVPGQALAALPPLLREAHGEALAAITVLDRDLLLVLQASHLVPPSAWAGIEAGVAAR